MASLVDRIYFRELSGQDPVDVCRRARCSHDDTRRSYALSVWGDEYRIFPYRFKIECPGREIQSIHAYFQLFIIHYLLNAKEIDISNEWISEKDIHGGPTFFRGPHEIPTHLITDRFETDINAFRERCGQLHGSPLDMADAAYDFQITTRIPVAVLYWGGDDEFAAEAKILYDRTITAHLASDIIWALAVGICERVGKPFAGRTVQAGADIEQQGGVKHDSTDNDPGKGRRCADSTGRLGRRRKNNPVCTRPDGKQ